MSLLVKIVSVFALCLAFEVNVSQGVEVQKVGQPLFCHGCVAVLKELHKVLKDSSGRKKIVSQKLDQLCQINNFVSYTFSPPKMIKACNYIVETHRKELTDSLMEYYRKFKTSDNLSLQENFCDKVIKACEGQRRPVKDSEMKPHGLSVDDANEKLQTMSSDKIEAQVEDTIDKPPIHTTPIPKEEL